MLNIQTFTFGPFSENTYIVSDPTGACVVVDPGCYDASEKAQVSDYIATNGLKLELILNTHCHLDHVFGNNYLVKKYGVPLLAPRKEMYNLEHALAAAGFFGVQMEASPLPDIFIDEQPSLTFGETTFEVLLTPGHSAGHVTFWHKEERKIFSGDVLFQGSIGRTDLPGGNYETLMESIFNVVLPLGDDVKVYAGHMGLTTVGEERRHNPFLLEYAGK